MLPLIGVTACWTPGEGKDHHSAKDQYVRAAATGAGGLPLVIPALGDDLDIATLIERLDGLLVTGSLSNVEPARYGGPEAAPGTPADPQRDATTLPLIRAALQAGLPVFAICRGLQELNVALGGSLHQRVHEVPGRMDHRSPEGAEWAVKWGPRHAVSLTQGGQVARLAGAEETEVNSLHWQAIDRLADRLAVEAVAPDGTVEAVRVKDAPGFALAVQWHPEVSVATNPLSAALFRAFGDAARERARLRTSARAA